MKHFLSGLLLILPIFCYAECNDSSKRILNGQEPTTSKLYKSARAMDMGAWKDGEFQEEHFYFLGSATISGKNTYVTYINTIWGSSCRATTRLIFFSAEYKPIAQYYAISQPTLKNNMLTFTPNEGKPSKVDISESLPENLNGGDDYYPITTQP